MPDISFTMNGVIIKKAADDESENVLEITFSSYDSEHMRLRSYVEDHDKKRTWNEDVVVTGKEGRERFEAALNDFLPDGILLTKITDDGDLEEYRGYFDRPGLLFLNVDDPQDVAALLSFDEYTVDGSKPLWCSLYWNVPSNPNLAKPGEWADFCQAAEDVGFTLSVDGTRATPTEKMGL